MNKFQVLTKIKNKSNKSVESVPILSFKEELLKNSVAINFIQKIEIMFMNYFSHFTNNLKTNVTGINGIVKLFKLHFLKNKIDKLKFRAESIKEDIFDIQKSYIRLKLEMSDLDNQIILTKDELIVEFKK
jgi:hypothetical protein